MRYTWLLFDADGTLFDYDRAEAAALQSTFEQMGQPFEPGYTENYRRFNGQIWLDFEQGTISQERLRTLRFERLFEAVGVDLSPEAFSPRYLQNLAQGTGLIDGAEEVVRALHGRIGLMLITNGLRDVQRPRFARSALNGYFAGLVISEEVGAAKPSARIFDVAFEQMGHPGREEVLMVGDSLTSDIRGGVDYGIDTCWFNPGRRPRDPELEIRYEIQELRQLLDLVGGDSPSKPSRVPATGALGISARSGRPVDRAGRIEGA
jgi:2-haloacid dehalogenase